MFGDAGHDDLVGHLGADVIEGGTGDDGIVGDKGTIVADLLDGTTQMTISSQANKVSATINVAGTRKRWVTLVDSALGSGDTIVGGEGNDAVHGGAGNDRIWGDTPIAGAAGGNDALFGNLGDDVINGGGGDDHLYGGAGADTLDGNAGAEITYGGDGKDTLIGDTNLDRLIDWFGNVNDFEVGGPGTGGPVVVRSPNPAMAEFLRYPAAGDGATDADGELALVMPPAPNNSGQ